MASACQGAFRVDSELLTTPEDRTIISLRQLRYFVRIVETGSMTRAAEHFRIAQTALGLQIRQLEQFLGVKLLDRHSRGVVPTPSGQLLFDRAQDILGLVDKTVTDVTRLGGKTADAVTIGLIPSQMQLLAHDLLLWAHKEMPTVLLRLIEQFGPHEAIQNGGVDLSLGCEVPEHPGIVRIPLLTEELIFVIAPDPAKPFDLDDQGLTRTSISFEELFRHPLAFCPRATEIGELAEAAARTVSRVPHVAYEVQSVQAIKTLVADGMATSILPYGSLRSELIDGRLIGRRIGSPGIRWTIYMSLPERRAATMSDALLSLLIEHTVTCLLRKLGALATPLWKPDGVLAPDAR
jgi:LysR family nitrogen assimilation transcriptional regulator